MQVIVVFVRWVHRGFIAHPSPHDIAVQINMLNLVVKPRHVAFLCPVRVTYITVYVSQPSCCAACPTMS